MKHLIPLLFAFLLLSCNKEEESVEVSYHLSNAYSTTYITYKNETDKLERDTLYFESGEDEKTYVVQLNKGDIVYFSALYIDTLSSVSIEILLDGKVFKSATSYNDAGKYTIVSATIPY